MTPPPRVQIADRYVLLHSLGRGGHGEVWEAHDQLAGARVAVKLFDSDAAIEPARIRREIAALRLLRLPGVVRMLDEGIARGAPFLVMEKVTGAPFPGGAVPQGWSAIAAATASLLATLRRIHAAGIVHRDLKPANVLVDAAGRATVLDFGFSWGGVLSSGLTVEGAILGTPAYLAPEQITGAPVTAATDLYAVGVMLYESLSGRLPHAGGDFVALMRARLTGPVMPLAEVAPGVPPGVARVVHALLARLPDHRPRSAEEAILALEGRAAPIAADLLPPEFAREDELRARFAGPDRLFHLREDAAHELWERTQGHPARVAAELDRWVREGLARCDGDLVAVDREALDSLATERAMRSSSATGRLFRCEEAAEITAEVIRVALPAAHAGRLGQAVAILADGLFAARRIARRRRATGDWGEARLLGIWAQIAVADSKPRALDRLLYEIGRAGERTPELGAIEGLVRAALALRTAGGDRALALVDADVPAFADPGLERVRWHVRVIAARRRPVEHEEAVLAEAAAWAAACGDEETEASLADWLGRLRYRQGRFTEAAALHAVAAEQERWTTARIDARLNGASALMEGFSLDAARAEAEAGRALAASCRHAYFEARAEWILRTIAYRSGRAEAPDRELIELSGKVDVAFIEGAVSITEAAVAFRAGHLEEGRALAKRAGAILVGEGREASALLTRSLAIACGDAVEEGEARALSERAARCPVSGIGIQVLGLLAPRCPDLRDTLHESARTLAAAIPRERWGERMDILSIEEALFAVERA